MGSIGKAARRLFRWGLLVSTAPWWLLRLAFAPRGFDTLSLDCRDTRFGPPREAPFWRRLRDRRLDLLEVLVALRDALKERFPDLLVAGEGWYDALGAMTPVSQVGTPARWDQVFSRYCRTFGHLMWGDPSRGSTGVHEAGTTGFGLVPQGRHWWPTVTIVDGTLERATDKVEQVIEQARQYARRYLE